MSSVEIRPANVNDIDVVVPCIYSSGPIAFDYVFSDGMDFLKQSFKKGQCQFGFQNHYVAELNETVVASIACFDRNQLNAMELPCIKEIFQYYGWRSIPVLLRGLSIERLIPKPIQHSLYIAHVGVTPEQRGTGIGTQLIAWAKEKAQRQGYQSLTLDVAKTNDGAEKLYRSLGFEDLKLRHSKIANLCDHKTMILKLR